MIGMAGDRLALLRQAPAVCLFGIGALLDDCYRQIVLILGREPDFLCDNAPVKWGQCFFGKRCISPRELKAKGTETAILITVRACEGIHLQLADMGFKTVFACHFGRSYNVVQDVFTPQSVLYSNKPPVIPVKGKWTFVTGASRGIGRHIVREMARLGSNILAHSRSVSHLDGIRKECEVHGVGFVTLGADLGKSDELERMLAELEQSVPQVDIVYNNAGISIPSPEGFWASPCSHYLESYMVNTIAPIRICQKVIPSMIQRNFGRVINVSSSIQKRLGEMAYACSKAALDKFVHDLAPSLDGTGVAISLLDPGWLKTDMGGDIAPLAVETVLPGALLGAVIDADMNGRWIVAQDYAGLDIASAIQKLNFIESCPSPPFG